MEHTEYGRWLQQKFGCKVQKLSIDAGFTCPNRDGRLGTGGCTFCRGESFTPSYCRRGLPVREQIEAGKRFFAHKYKDVKFLAYFQSYSNTYAELPHLQMLYEEAIAAEDVVGLAIATRPDCVDAPLLDYLAELSRRTFVCVEYGVESVSDATLRRIRRGHDFEASRRAIEETARRGIYVGAHIILGFPWESHDELMRQADVLARLPLTTLKLHQLQVLRGTPLEAEYLRSPWPMPTAGEYIRLALDYLSHLPSGIVLDRLASQSPPDMVVAPKWGLRSSEFQSIVRQTFAQDRNDE